MTMGANPKFVPVCMGKQKMQLQQLRLLLILASDQVSNFDFHSAEALDSDSCPLPYNRTVDSPTFRSCVDSAELAETRSLWLFAAGCFGGVILVLLGKSNKWESISCNMMWHVFYLCSVLLLHTQMAQKARQPTPQPIDTESQTLCDIAAKHNQQSAGGRAPALWYCLSMTIDLNTIKLYFICIAPSSKTSYLLA